MLDSRCLKKLSNDIKKKKTIMKWGADKNWKSEDFSGVSKLKVILWRKSLPIYIDINNIAVL